MRHALMALLPLIAAACVPNIEIPIDTDGGVWDNQWFVGEGADEITGVEGWSVGNVVPYGELTAYNNETFYTHQFVGRVWVLDLGALWCNPCHQLANFTESTYRDYHGAGNEIEYLTIINQNVQSQTPTVEEINKLWVDIHCIVETPVVTDDAFYTDNAWPERALPVVYVIDENLVIQERMFGAQATEPNVRAAIERVAGIAQVPETNEPCGGH
jgi:hypothetical protein